MAVKLRFHKGTTTFFRQRLRLAGMSVDEEIAQRMLAGLPVAVGMPQEIIDRVKTAALDESGTRTRFDIMREWENDNPGQRPFPPPFAERVLDLAKEAEQTLSLEGDPSIYLGRISALCRAELGDDPFLPDF